MSESSSSRPSRPSSRSDLAFEPQDVSDSDSDEDVNMRRAMSGFQSTLSWAKTSFHFARPTSLSSLRSSLFRAVKMIGHSRHSRINDDHHVFTWHLIALSILVAVACGFAAFLLHLSVGYAGCLGGVNGCHDHYLLDVLEPLGIGKSVLFIVGSGLSGLLCSFILYSPIFGAAARVCKGGGSGHTKIVVASGATVSGWVVVLRIVLASIYMGGGNPLGTEGPIIHMSVSLATWLVSKVAKRRRKFLGTFAVIGAAAGISAGFNVLVTGFVYVIEELTRTLSRKLALILAFAAAVAVLFKEYVEKFLVHYHLIHADHASLVPEHKTWDTLTDSEIQITLLLSVPIGILMGIAGWIFTHCAWDCLLLLNSHPRLMKFFPQQTHLAIIGVACGCLGAIGYEVTGANGVWGTTVGAIPEVIEKKLPWEQVLLLFVLKFAAFILATAAGGPGGLLVPSLVTGGLLAVALGRMIDDSIALCSACAVIGMGAMFSSVMHMPLTGVIIMFELTGEKRLMLHVVIANFISSNVVARLPHGNHSFVHRALGRDETWNKLNCRDFMETDEHEQEANLALFESLKPWLLTDLDRCRIVFDSWVHALEIIKLEHEAQANEAAAMSPAAQKLKRAGTSLNFLMRFKNAKSVTTIFGSDASETQEAPMPERGEGRHDGARAQARPRARSSHWGALTNSIGRSPQPEVGVVPVAADNVKSSNSLPCAPATILITPVSSLEPEAMAPRAKRNTVCSIVRIPELATRNDANNSAEQGAGKLLAEPNRERGSDRTHTRGAALDVEELRRRQVNREHWNTVSTIIPNLNVRVWKALDFNQREALSGIAIMLGKPACPSSSFHPQLPCPSPSPSDDVQLDQTQVDTKPQLDALAAPKGPKSSSATLLTSHESEPLEHHPRSKSEGAPSELSVEDV